MTQLWAQSVSGGSVSLQYSVVAVATTVVAAELPQAAVAAAAVVVAEPS